MTLSYRTRLTILRWWLHRAAFLVDLPAEAMAAIVISAGAIVLAILAAEVTQ